MSGPPGRRPSARTRRTERSSRRRRVCENPSPANAARHGQQQLVERNGTFVYARLSQHAADEGEDSYEEKRNPGHGCCAWRLMNSRNATTTIQQKTGGAESLLSVGFLSKPRAAHGVPVPAPPLWPCAFERARQRLLCLVVAVGSWTPRLDADDRYVRVDGMQMMKERPSGARACASVLQTEDTNSIEHQRQSTVRVAVNECSGLERVMDTPIRDTDFRFTIRREQAKRQVGPPPTPPVPHEASAAGATSRATFPHARTTAVAFRSISSNSSLGSDMATTAPPAPMDTRHASPPMPPGLRSRKPCAPASARLPRLDRTQAREQNQGRKGIVAHRAARTWAAAAAPPSESQC